MSRGAAPLLQVRDLDVDLGGRAVLREVDLTVKAGQILGLVGPNGAGKTTALRSVVGLVPRRAGQVLVDGSPARRGRTALGYVPQRQDVAWDYPVTVADTVASGLTGTRWPGWRPGAAAWGRVRAALERVDVLDLALRPLGELSGGQRQRVLVARALVRDSRLLLLDEPATGLDVPSQDLLARLLRELADDGYGVLLTTHDLLGAVDVCDEVALVAGRIVRCGPAAEVARDDAAWMEAFGVGADSVLLRALRAV